ncbi:MAG: hypothetical protein NC033_00670 [Clostridiales bacterium]|nr:hypothetical protein [Clostridiales bacterium]
MSAYVKKIAVIKQVKGGFSADGGAVSGLVKCETYAGFLKVEASLINFAPLTEGRYVLGVTDGLKTVTFEGTSYEGEGDFNLSLGFAFLVCFCHNTVAPIASAACGQMACALPDLKEEMTRLENIRPPKGGAAYDDEAIAEVNYYESTFEGGAAVCEAETQEEGGRSGGENEEDTRAVESEEKGGVEEVAAVENAGGERIVGGLAGGDFYSRMEGDIKRIFANYPAEPALESAMEGSRFARISYGENKFYVFGVLRVEGKPRYICYGVPAQNGETPPPSLKAMASYVPTESGGYWLTYQDAATGVSIKIMQS